MLQASVTSLAWDKCSLSLTSEIFLPTVSGLKYTHPSVTLFLFFPSASLCLLEKTRWAEPRPCNLRPDFHWKQMLSIHRKDRLMFSKAYNNKPRGSSHASWRNRGKRPQYQLSEWVSERVVTFEMRWEAWEEREREKGKQGREEKQERTDEAEHG